MEKGLIALVILTYILCNLVSAGCPGKELAGVKIEYSFDSELTGSELEVGTTCAPDSPLGFGIRNYKNDDILIYVDGKGIEHEIWPYQSADEINYNESLPHCNQWPGYSQCSHELKCTSANAIIIEGYMCFDNQVCCDFENVDNANEWYEKSFYKEEDIPQEIGAEWTRELYFKNSPEEKITLYAKNVAIENRTSVIKKLFIIVATLIILGIVLIIIKILRKFRSN
ncbi:MAG: hypothetical protein ABIE22_00200 [archaeon]